VSRVLYNAGQKPFSFVIDAMIPVVMLTGLVMAFRARRWMPGERRPAA
jgi:cytochrome b subunit of formate dehydrogenase